MLLLNSYKQVYHKIILSKIVIESKRPNNTPDGWVTSSQKHKKMAKNIHQNEQISEQIDKYKVK